MISQSPKTRPLSGSSPSKPQRRTLPKQQREKTTRTVKAPVTIFVLDLLNSEFQEGAYFRQELHKYLEGLPSELAAPAELIVLGNDNLELVQGYTRSRKELLFALDHAPTIVPYKRTNSDFVMDRAQQSIDALQQIVLQNEGIPGRKNVIWIGPGSPTLSAPEDIKTETTLKNYIHMTANMLVEARISLFVIYPPLKLEKRSDTFNPSIANTDFQTKDPFGSAVSFVDFVRETGGDLFFNRNDIDGEIQQSEVFGSKYYTLTYQPREGAERRLVSRDSRDTSQSRSSRSDQDWILCAGQRQASRSAVPRSCRSNPGGSFDNPHQRIGSKDRGRCAA